MTSLTEREMKVGAYLAGVVSVLTPVHAYFAAAHVGGWPLGAVVALTVWAYRQR